MILMMTTIMTMTVLTMIMMVMMGWSPVNELEGVEPITDANLSRGGNR